MGMASNLGKQASKRIAPKLIGRAPKATSAAVREALKRAINGVGRLPGAAAAADEQLREQRGDVEGAVHEVIENHVRYAGLAGFATNIGGLVTAAVTLPANITGLAIIQCRLIAGIAHLRGYDLSDPRVQNAILVTMLGEETITSLLKARKIPAPPMAIATAPTHDPALDQVVSSEVAAHLVASVTGKRLATVAGKRVPLVGGLVGAGVDGYSTWKVGRYADREFLSRAAR